MSDDSTAYFRFGTNVNETAAQVEAGMGRIRRALSEGAASTPPKVGAAAGALNTTAIENNLRDAQTRIRTLMSRLGEGSLPAGQFRKKVEAEIRGALGGIPGAISEGLAGSPASVARGLRETPGELGRIGRVSGEALVRELLLTIDTAGPAIQSRLARLRIPLAPGRFAEDVEKVAATPTGPAITRRGQLINEVRMQAEDAKNFSPQKQELDDILKKEADDRKRANDQMAAGRLRELQERQRATQQIRAGAEDEKRDRAKETAERRTATQQIRAGAEDEARDRAAEKAVRDRAKLQSQAGRIDTARDASAQAATQKLGGLQTAAQNIDQGLTNAKRLTENFSRVIPVGRYHVLDGEVFKVNQGLAHQITEGLEFEAVQKRITRLTQEQARAQARRQGGILGGAFNKLGGASGEQSIGQFFGSHLASAAVFAASYGALFAVQGAIRDTIKEYIDYQDSLTDLQVATRQSGAVTDEWVDSLSGVARVVGENLGAALDTAARGVRAFGDPLKDTKSEIQDIGSATNDAATKLALISSKPLKDATGDLIAVGTSYKFQPDQLAQVTDAVANAKRNLGGDPAEISQGLASIASSAASSGFNVNQAADLISIVQGRLDESGTAAATRLSRIFQITGGTTGRTVAKELGVDPSKSVRQQLLGKGGFADIYNADDTSQAVKNRIKSQLGGTANLRELLALLENHKQLLQADAESAKNAGAANAEFNRKADSLAGTLTKIKGSITSLQTDFGRSDLGVPFAAAIYAIEPLLALLDRLAKMYIEVLPKGAKIALGGFADVLIAAKAISVLSNARAASSKGGLASKLIPGNAAREAEAEAITATTGTRVAAEEEEVAVIQGATAQRLAAEEAFIAMLEGAVLERTAVETGENTVVAESTVERAAVETRENAVIGLSTKERGAAELGGDGAALLGRRGGIRGFAARSGETGILAGLGRILKFATNTRVLAGGAILGGAILAEKAFEGKDQRDSYYHQAGDTSHAYGRIDGTAGSLKRAADDLRSASGEVAQNKTSIFSKGTRENVQEDLATASKQLQTLYRNVSAEQARDAKKANESAFGDGGVITSVSQLAVGITSMSEAGVTAATRMRILQKALEGTATPKSGQRLSGAVSGELAGQVMGGLKDALAKKTAIFEGPELLSPGAKPGAPGYRKGADGTVYTRGFSVDDRDRAFAALQANNNINDIDKAVREKAAGLGLKKGDLLTEETKNQLAQAAVNALDLTDVNGNKADIRKRLLKIIQNNLTDQSAGGAAARQINGRGALNANDIIQLLHPSTGKDQSWQGLVAVQQAAEQDIPASDDGTKLLASRKAFVAMLHKLRARLALSGQSVGELALDIKNAEDSLIETALAQSAVLRAHAQNKAGLNKEQIRSIGRDFLEKDIKTAGTDAKRLIDIMNNADDASIRLVLAHIDAAIKVARAAARDADKLASVDAPLLPDDTSDKDYFLLHGFHKPKPPKAPKTAEDKRLTELEKRRDAIERARKRANVSHDAFGGAYAGGGDIAGPSDGNTAAQRAAAQQRVHINSHNAVALARNTLATARANLAATNRNDKGYFDAVQAVIDAQQGLAVAIGDRSTALANLAAAKAGGGAMATAKAGLATARIALSTSGPAGTADHINALAGLYSAQTAARQAAADRTGAIASANAARIGGPTAEARAQLRGAAANLHANARGTTEWFNALGSFYSAQQAMRDAAIQYKNNIDLLHGDATDPVEQARDALRAARRKLHAARNRDDRAQGRVDVDAARSGLSGAKFDQRFSDMQTAEDLGRISFAKYMNYLDHEHDRLSKIGHRTRQQQDQLDQVDKAMKDALNQMDSQFNLGDINTKGLVYQVRRFAAQDHAAINGARVTQDRDHTTHQTVTIHVNGADTAKVKSILDTYLRIDGGQRRTLTRRKV